MKKFLINSSVFISLSIILFHAEPLYLYYTGKYKLLVLGKEIYHAIEKSKTKNKSKKVLLGDSVATQLFDPYSDNDSIISLACNQTIAMAGQYILLKNYLDAGNKVDTVYLLVRPFTFQNNLDQVYTYHYFLKPFYNKEFKPDLSPAVEKQIEKIPYHRFCQYPPILTSDWSPDFKSKDSIDFTFLSPISVEYLKKMKQLEKSQGFKLIILPAPISNEFKKDLSHLNKAEISNNNLDEEFKSFFDKLLIMDDSLFKDGSHFKDPEKYSKYYKEKFSL